MEDFGPFNLKTFLPADEPEHIKSGTIMCHNILVEKREDLIPAVLLLTTLQGNVYKWLSGAWINSENNIRNENHEYAVGFQIWTLGWFFFLQQTGLQ